MERGGDDALRDQPRAGSAPRPGQPRVPSLPGGFPHKVREGEVPVIVQPRFHRVVVPRPRGAGARPLHARAARPCASRGPVPPLPGSLPGAAASAPRPSPAPGRVRAAPGRCAGAGPARSPAPPLRVRAPGAAGGAGAQPRLRRSGQGRLPRPLESPVPRQPRRRLASSPEAPWPRPEGSARPLGCAAHRAGSGSPGGDGCVRECPSLGKGRSRRGGPSPAQGAVAGGRSPERKRGCHPGRFSSGLEQ